MSLASDTTDGGPESREAGLPLGSNRREQRWKLGLLGLLLLAVAALLRLTFYPELYADEVEHAHVTWAMSQGIMPYRDIHQIHLPLLWITASPLFSLLPESLYGALALRVLCLMGLAGAIAAGLLALDEIEEEPTTVQRFFLILVAVAFAGYFQFYRYRPDPFMAMFAAWSIVAMLRMHRNPPFYAFLAGAGLGVAAGFSTKMVSMCLMVPLFSLFEAMRSRSWGPLLVGVPNLAGFLSVALPLLCWLQFRSVLDEFIQWSIVNNSHMVGPSVAHITHLLVPGPNVWLFAALCTPGALVLLRRALKGRSRSWSPLTGFLIATGLAWMIRAIEPNHFDYNLQAVLVPGAILASVTLMELKKWPWAWPRRIVIALLLFAILWRPVVVEAYHLRTPGVPVSGSTLEEMIRLTRVPGAECVGFAPVHPIFCRDATDLYLSWDLEFLQQPWMSPEGKRPYLEMWPRAMDEIREKRPVLVVNDGYWERAHRLKAVTADRHREFMALMQNEYEAIALGGHRVWVRADAR